MEAKRLEMKDFHLVLRLFRHGENVSVLAGGQVGRSALGPKTTLCVTKPSSLSLGKAPTSPLRAGG